MWSLGADTHAQLVRFGQGQPHTLAGGAWNYASGRGDGVWGLSVWWWPDITPEETVWRAWQVKNTGAGRNPFVQSVYRCWNRQSLHDFDAAITVRATYGPGHYTVELPSFVLERDFDPIYHEDRSNFPAYELNTTYFDELSGLLGPAVPNPVRTL